MSTPPVLTSTGAIASDAEPGEVKAGRFLKLSECPTSFQVHFNNAREAIESGHMEELREAVAAMKENSAKSCLDVCEMVRAESGKYPMTLLAYAGYHDRKDMFSYLLSQGGAHIDMGNQKSGTPLLQMMVYAYIKQREENLPTPKIKVSIIKLFIDNGAVLSRVLMAPDFNKYTALQLAISFNHLDVVKVFIEAGADPILCGDGVISPVLVEYTLFGTHNFVRWLLNDHLTQSQMPAFINRLLQSGVLFGNAMKHIIMEVYGKSPAHAFLLCGHRQTIQCLVQRKPELLEECDPFGRTALHLAAEEGDVHSVKILLDCKAPIDVEDNNFTTPIMMAIKHNKIKVVVEMIEAFIRTSQQCYNQLWLWALEHGYTSCFQALHETGELESVMESPVDTNGNTIAHIAAKGGYISFFKKILSERNEFLYEILMKENHEGKTPLNLAIENREFGILTAVQETDKTGFWERESPELLLHACRSGNVAAVKHFTTSGVSPTFRYGGEEHLTPLSAAAKSGKHEIVAFLLSIPGVTAEGIAENETLTPDEKEHSPLMLASKHGHAKCVQLLLERGADIDVVSDRKYNCLMESIDGGYKETAIALLKYYNKDRLRHEVKQEDETIVTPLTMLIEEMPGVAKKVFTMCATSDDDFELLEPNAQKKDHSHHPLTVMVNCNRLELLHHPLVSNYISLQWSRLLIPFSIYMFFYILFLILLTIFVVIIPRPGPDNKYCNYSSSSEVPSNNTDKPCDSKMAEQLSVLSAFIIITCVIFLPFQIIFIISDCYIEFAKSVFGLSFVLSIVLRCIFILMFILSIIFVSGFGNDCWCTPPWQWQIGALAVFLAYILLVISLKDFEVIWFSTYINLLIKIVVVFIKLAVLPFMLIVSFALPFYMLFVRDSNAIQTSGSIRAFSSPANAIVKVLFQTAGEVEFETLFNDGDLLYSTMAYILFIVFVILMPLLFQAMLIGLVVGIADEDIENTKLREIELKVKFILRWGPQFEKCSCWKYWDQAVRLLVKKLRGVKEPQKEKEDFKLVKDNVESVLGLENSLLSYVDQHFQTLHRDMKTMRTVMEQIQMKESRLQDSTSKDLKKLHTDMSNMREKLEGLHKKMQQKDHRQRFISTKK